MPDDHGHLTPQRDPEQEAWITAEEAASMIRMPLDNFRRAVNRHEALKQAQITMTKHFALYHKESVIAWAATRRKRKRRS